MAHSRLAIGKTNFRLRPGGQATLPITGIQWNEMVCATPKNLVPETKGKREQDNPVE
jgi:hypothetical protein